MKTDEEIHNDIVEMLLEIDKSKDTRKTIISLGIISEYLVNEFLRIKLGTELDKINSEDIKLKILKATKIFSEIEYNILNKLRQIRNAYAHQIDIDDKKIEQLMLKTPMDWQIDNIDPAKDGEKMGGENPLHTFKISVQIELLRLFQRLSELKNNKNNNIEGLKK